MYILKLAKEKSKKSPHPKARHVAILFSGRRVLGVATNQREIHAEDRVIRKMYGRNMSNMILFSAKVDKKGNFTMAKPCRNCQTLISKNNIKNIVYTDSRGEVVHV